MAKRIVRRPDGSTSGQIDIRDPFQLVRHLARSQSDPRKAVAELVQNALDEQSSKIELSRRREHREVVLSVLDNGLGVLPDLARDEALTTIAKSIGQSRKRQMSSDERMRAAMLGQYGIGLLGFWSLGHELRMISRVNDSPVFCLTLWEDSPKYEVYPVPPDVLHGGGTWTEVQVRRLHPAAIPVTAGGRLSTYLSVELRGQLLLHGTELTIVDAVSRSTKDRVHVVRPSALAGKKLGVPQELAVPGFPYPASLQLYFAGDSEEVALKLACAGAIVEDALRLRGTLDFPPWNDARLAGIIDFPHLEVPPGSRRGVVYNDAFHGLVEALRAMSSEVGTALDTAAAADAAELSGETQKQLAKWFRQATRHVPHLDWFSLAGRRGVVEGEGLGAGVSNEARPGAEGEKPPAIEQPEEEPAQPSLLLPGPWTRLGARPRRLALGLGERKTLRVFPVDADGRPTADDVHVEVTVHGLVTCTAVDARTWLVEAANAPSEGELVFVSVLRPSVRLVVPLAVSDAQREGMSHGIPTPDEVNEPQAAWRSRWVGERWQVNVGHADYGALSASSRARLQYMAYLLAKEVIARNFPRPEMGSILEEMVGVLAALERARLTSSARHNAPRS